MNDIYSLDVLYLTNGNVTHTADVRDLHFSYNTPTINKNLQKNACHIQVFITQKKNQSEGRNRAYERKIDQMNKANICYCNKLSNYLVLQEQSNLLPS